MKNYKVFRGIMIFLCLFIGIGALGGGLFMLIEPSGVSTGFNNLLPYFQVLPFADVLFQNFIFSGIMLIIVNGITNILASIFLFKNKKSGIVLGTIFGITLMMWIIIQFCIFPFNFMSTIYFVFGFLQFVTGYCCYVFYEQNKFVFDENNYKSISNNSDVLVVYFSRKGYTKKIAYEIANENNAEILEITTPEKTDKTSGFWWCGRFAMHKWGMKINQNNLNLDKYSKVIICSPLWCFSVCAPIREFCKMYSKKISKVEYVLVHFMKAKFTKVALEMDNILNIKHSKLTSICCRMGKFKTLNQK